MRLVRELGVGLGRVQSENPVSHPVEVSGIPLAVGLELWGAASFL